MLTTRIAVVCLFITLISEVRLKLTNAEASSVNHRETEAQRNRILVANEAPKLVDKEKAARALQSGSSVTVIITTDDYPSETSFYVQNQNGQKVMTSGSYTEKRTTYTHTKTLPDDNYVFTISDSYDDGICCAFGNGAYNLFVNNVLVKAGAVFTSSESTSFSTLSPINPPTSKPVNSPTNPPGACGTVSIFLTTDDYPTETSFQVQNQNGQIVMAGNSYTEKRTTYSDSSCLPYAVYNFIIRDSYADGICCSFGNGGYNLFVNNVLVKVGGVFTSSESVQFSSQGLPVAPTPAPCIPEVILGEATWFGSGCPNDSVKVIYSGDKQVLSILFSKYSSSTSDQKMNDSQTCQLAIPVESTCSTTMGIFGLDYRGNTFIPEGDGGFATFSAEYFFSGSKGPVVQRSFTKSESFTINNEVQGEVQYSGCNDPTIFRINTMITANKSNLMGENVEIALDSTDISTTSGLNFFFDIRNC